MQPTRRWRRRVVAAVLLLAVLGGVAALVLAVLALPDTGIVKAAKIVLLILAPSLLFGAICCAPRGFRAARRLIDSRRAEAEPQPTGPPIERIAADLRRLLWQHDLLTRSADLPMRARRLWGLEAAITDCTIQAARAIDVPHPDRPAHAGFDRAQLRRLLRNLADAGLVLPRTAGLLAPDSASDL